MSPAAPNAIVCAVAPTLVLYVHVPALKTAASVLPSPLKSPGATFGCEHPVVGGTHPIVKSEYEPPLLFLTFSSALAECHLPMSAFPSLSKSKSTTLDG